MNGFFANLGAAQDSPENGDRNSPDPDPDPQCTIYADQQGNENNFTLVSISKFETEVLIKRIDTSKSSGIISLSSKLLKDSFQVLIDQLVFLFNFSIRTASFPSQWKKALVIPIPKTGDLKKVENYRPISLLPLPGKNLEKLVHTQLSFYLEEDNPFRQPVWV